MIATDANDNSGAAAVRGVVLGLGMLGLAQGASAADLPAAVLRGPIVGELVPAYRWDGIYGGGQVGFSTANIDFTNGVRALVADEVRLLTIEQDQQISQWPLLPKKNPVGGSFGAFVGYNWQWDDAVVGLELNYNWTSLSASTASSIRRTFNDSDGLIPPHNYFYDVTVTGAASHILPIGARPACVVHGRPGRSCPMPL